VLENIFEEIIKHKQYFMMTKNVLIVFMLAVLTVPGNAQKIKPEEVKETMIKVADWQIEHYRDVYTRKEPHHPLDWTNGALYVGMTQLAAMHENDKYYEWLKGVGEQAAWSLHKRVYHADDHTVGQMYCDLFRKYGDTAMIEPAMEQFEFILYHPSLSVLNWRTPFHQDRWNWCDALFMSPPVWAKFYNITGDERYLDFMVKEFKATTDFLFDKEEHLYYRDERFIDQRDHGTKIFWSRGNGWVFAGLVNIMNELDPASEEYAYFEDLYKKMAEKLIEIQTPQGHWAMSLLGQGLYPTPETSGSSFFVYGLAWGLNNGVLSGRKYEKAVKKGWNAMTSYVTEEGMLGYVQPIGAAPGEAWPDKTEVYGTGAFLSAGSEVYKLYSK
jgi:rhamnogalacturonyl hydrolase YesR